jgi:hypothetical protein
MAFQQFRTHPSRSYKEPQGIATTDIALRSRDRPNTLVASEDRQRLRVRWPPAVRKSHRDGRQAAVPKRQPNRADGAVSEWIEGVRQLAGFARELPESSPALAAGTFRLETHDLRNSHWLTKRLQWLRRQSATSQMETSEVLSRGWRVHISLCKRTATSRRSTGRWRSLSRRWRASPPGAANTGRRAGSPSGTPSYSGRTR